MKLTNLMLAVAFSASVFLYSCGDDDAPQVFDEPTIAVVVDNSEPFQGDQVTFTITVAALGGLSEVTLDGTVIKSYTNSETSDTFEYPLTISEEQATGPTGLQFGVSDTQTEVMTNTFDVSLTIQNSDLRGTPVVFTDFQTTPNDFISSFNWPFVEDGSADWMQAYFAEIGAEDPTNAANFVYRANRLGATEWGFDGFGAVLNQLVDPIPEEEAQALASGERVLQMNIYFDEVQKIISAHTDPNNVDGTRFDDADASFYHADSDGGWNYEMQDSLTTGISVQIDLGNFESWGDGNGFRDGRGLRFFGTITEANVWQTVTFSVGKNVSESTDLSEASIVPSLIGESGDFIDQTNVNASNLNYLILTFNAGFQGFVNPNGWFEIPSNGNGWASDRVITIRDDHNSYLIDNIRVIDADVYDQNPNQ